MNDHLASRRSFARETVHWRAAVMTAQGSFPSWVRDVSAIGAFVALEDVQGKVGVGDEVVLVVTLPVDQELLSLRAEVRWVGPSREHHCEGFGVLFSSIAPRIATLLDDVAPESHTDKLPLGVARVVNKFRKD